MRNISALFPVALTIAGSDPSGGAGIQADLKTFHRFQVYGTSAITLVTVQNTVGVTRVELLAPDLILEQIGAVLSDLPVAAIKIGALGGTGAIEALATLDFPCPLVIDPVMISKHGVPLMGEDARNAFGRLLLPKASLITPNLHEAGVLTGIEVDSTQRMKEAAACLHAAGAQAVLVKGGHLEGDAVDILLVDGRFEEFRSPRTPTRHTHGTGCTYSAAITSLLAHGYELTAAVAEAKRFISAAIRTAPGLGDGSGPVNHWAGTV